MAVIIPADIIDEVRAQATQMPTLQTSITLSQSALSSIFWAVGYQTVMLICMVCPLNTTISSDRQEVSPFSGICHTVNVQSVL